MGVHSKAEKANIAIIKATTPKNCVKEGIEKLGGISKFINKGDQVFIKFNLSLPNGFPTHTSFEVLETIIQYCRDAGAKKIIVGSFPTKGVTIKSISDILGLVSYFRNIGAELAFLDNSNNYERKGIKTEHLKNIKSTSFSGVEINKKKFLVPKVIIDSDKYIIVNQVNVNPLFKCNLALLNSYSIVPRRYQKIIEKSRINEEYLSNDQYKRDVISEILDVYTLKQPDIIINDLFYVLEGAGPYIYKDSSLKKTGVILIGDDAVSVDTLTLKLMSVDFQDSELMLEARNRMLGITEMPKIQILGEKIENIKINIEFCPSKLEDIKVRNLSIKTGQYCSGCFKQAYHLLNLMKTIMVKDLKYNPTNSFLIGVNPLDPENPENVILFGDCAINSTKTSNFRRIKKKPRKTIVDEAKNKILKKSKSKKKKNFKGKPNKKILELSGCPPTIFNCIELILEYYGKSNVPNLTLFDKTIKLWTNKKIKEKLELWEALEVID